VGKVALGRGLPHGPACCRTLGRGLAREGMEKHRGGGKSARRGGKPVTHQRRGAGRPTASQRRSS